jgi:hypothetical protein
MKKNLFPILSLIAGLTTISSHSAPFWYDVVTNYPVGCITTNTANWYPHLPGGLTANDALVVSNTYTTGAAVNGKHLRINGLNSEYIMRLFDPVNTNAFSSGFLYASFIANANFVPAAGVGTYFAAFNDLGSPPSATNGFEFRGRIFEIGNTNAYPFTNRVSSTYSFGVANAAGDPAQGGGPSILFPPIDLKGNIDYQVVLKYDIDNAVAYLWVNPASESDTANMAGPTSDSGAVATGLAGLLFRQRTAGGTVDVRDIAVGTSFADVMTNVLADTSVQVATNFNTVANFAGNPALLEVFATSIGGGPLSYQWYQIAAGVTNAVVGGTNQTYVLSQTAGSDTGNYFCAVTNSGGIGALSRTNFAITVNATPTGLSFGSQAASKGASVGSTLTLSASVNGTGPISYQWNFNGSPLTDGQPATALPGDASLVSGSQTPNLTVKSVSTNETGDFSLTATTTASVSPNSITSSNAHITVNPPVAVSIAFLRSLEDKTTWQPTDTASTFSISGVITTVTNLTSGNTSSYYIQDSTAGINLFVTGDNTFRPTRGDLVTAAGTLSSFNNSLEIVCVAGNPYEPYAIVSHSNAVPAPAVFSPTLTNNAGLMETNWESRFVMLTNVFFPNPAGTYPNGANVTVTNMVNGVPVPFAIFVSAQVAEVTGQPMPTFAWSVLGVISQSKSGAYSSAGYSLDLTTLADVITDPPPPVTASVALAGANIALSWPAVPNLYSYSVLVAVDVNGPYVPLATGLTFNTTNGGFMDTQNSVYQASLFGTNEVPSNSSTATGFGFVVLSPDQKSLIVNESWSGLGTTATASHIHGPAAPGVNASVLFPFTGVPSATSGSIPQQSFTVSATQLGYLQTGLLYMNVHSVTFGGGEIRGQLYPATTKFYKITSP